MDAQKFLGLFKEVLAPDTNRVKAATSTLRADYYPLPESLIILLQLLLSDQPSDLRQLAASQARSLVPKHWKKLPSEQKANFRQQLLQGTLQEEEQIVQHAAARVIVSIAKIDTENGEWEDFLDILLRAANNPDPRQRDVGTFLLFTSLESLGDNMMPRFHEMLQIFSKTIRDPDNAVVRINTMLALSRLAIVMDTDADEPSLKIMQALIPQMILVLKQAVDEGDEERATQSFEVFQTLLGCDSTILNPAFGDLIQFMITVAANTTLDEDARTQALNFLMQCVRYRKLKMQSLKVGEQLTLKSLEIVTEIGDGALEDDDMTTPRCALGLLDEMATTLPPSQVVVPLLHNLGPYVTSSDPDRRQAGIMALGMIVEGAPDFINTQLHEIFPLVMRLLGDGEMKVRRAALDCVMRIAEELPEELGKEHQKLMPAVVIHLDNATKSLSGPEDKANMDTIKACTNCIDCLVEGMDSDDIEPYISELMSRLTQLYQHHPDFKIKAVAIQAIGNVAACAKSAFLPYFEDTMNSLSEYVEMKDSAEELDLRSTTCDSMGSMALAVGPREFQRYVRPLMLATMEGTKLDHPKLKETSYLFWGTMAKVYEGEFKPFLENVLEALFECLATEESELEVDLGDEAEDLAGKEITIGGKKIKVAALSNDDIVSAEDIEDLDDEIADADSDDDWDDMDIVTAVAQEKEIAVEALGEILTHTTRDYLPYMEKTVETVVPLLEHSYEGVQKAAISTLFRAYTAMWSLQSDEQKRGQPSSQIQQLGGIVITGTLGIWQEEEDRGTVVEINRSLAETLTVTGHSLLSDIGTLKHVCEILHSILNKNHSCQKDFGDEEDLGLFDETSESDWATIDSALDVLIGVAKALGREFDKIWKEFEKPLLKFASGSDSKERSTSVGVIAECIRAMGPAITPFTTTLLKAILHRMSDEDPQTKSNAAYAAGLLQEKSTNDQEILKAFPTILSKLEPLLSMEEARCKDNAGGCVSRMIMKHPSKIPIAQVLPALLDILPLREDFEENEPIYDMIVKLYSENNKTIMALTPQVLPVLAEVTSGDPSQLKDDTREKISQLVKFLASKHPREVQKYEGLAALM